MNAHRRHTARHMNLATTAIAEATEALEAGLPVRAEASLRSALHQFELISYTGPEYKAAVGDIALIRFSYTR